MFKRNRGLLFLALGLILTSAILYTIHYQMFHDFHHLAVFFVEDVAFIPIEVLIVTLIIHRALHNQEKRRLMNKMNMAIGTFFSHVGNDLLRQLRTFDGDAPVIDQIASLNHVETVKDFNRLKNALSSWEPVMMPVQGDLAELRGFLMSRTDFLMRMLENQNLLEHESFTDLLWAVFHLADELSHRSDFSEMPAEDIEHIAGDLLRAYRAAVLEWVDYMKHLKSDYPYLYSLADRLNPFGVNRDAVIRKA